MASKSTISSQLATTKKFFVPAALLIGGLLCLWILLNVASGVLGVGTYKQGYGVVSESMVAPSVSSVGRGAEVADALYYDGGFMPPPVPTPTSYVPNLEQYETTDYYISARTREFDSACAILAALKARSDVDFKSLQQSANTCSAAFFTDVATANSVLEKINVVSGVDVSRTTESVTRRREQLKNQGDILREQLASVERTLSEAERQYDEITEVARAASDASALTEAIRFKLEMMDSLTNRRITLTSQLQNLSQQAADLEERIGVVAFSVHFNRAYAVDSNWAERRWEVAWQELRQTVTEVMIGFSAYLGIFLMRALQFVAYGIILIVVTRFLWKFVRKIWTL